MSQRRFETVGLANPGWTLGLNQPDYLFERNDQYRVPLYSLAHHGEVVISWRYEDSFHRSPTYWPAKNLFCILHGNPPLFYLTRDYYYRFRPQLRATARTVCPWTRLVGYDEMVSHRFVTADRTVQESLFSSGHGAVVNFSSQPRILPDGAVVPGLGWLIFTGDHPRACQRASGAAVEIPARPVPVTDLTENFEGGYCRFFDPGASFDWMQYRGVTKQRGLVISGKYSFLAENLNARHNHEAILRSTPYFVPLKPGATYEISFRHRLPRDSAKLRLTITTEAEGRKAVPASPSGWDLTPGQEGSLKATITVGQEPDTELVWSLTGIGRIVLDDLHLQEVKSGGCEAARRDGGTHVPPDAISDRATLGCRAGHWQR